MCRGVKSEGAETGGVRLILETLNARIPAAGTRGIEPSLYVFIIHTATDFIVWQKKCCAKPHGTTATAKPLARVELE
ncbi:MAG: hypothetical protein AUK63_1083 [bacterium P3]|nr:MAG: hypothetical protein AUK63_1083 [bacterium P3]KWW40776.1 MAG: hypothetical protein F083_1431 [bacterium F083]